MAVLIVSGQSRVAYLCSYCAKDSQKIDHIIS